MEFFLEYNWGYKTEPVKGACLGLNGGVWYSASHVLIK